MIIVQGALYGPMDLCMAMHVHMCVLHITAIKYKVSIAQVIWLISFENREFCLRFAEGVFVLGEFSQLRPCKRQRHFLLAV